MTTSNLSFNSLSQATPKKAKRIGAAFALALISTVIGLSSAVQPASASCYGSGHSRYCDGIGGPGATYSDRGSYGTTTYSNGSVQTYYSY